ncbi:MAG: hypothetical protein KGL75_13520 [Acidobacteriota bacterium]|nr:hypothetical protein [Acidobacteriota bacterium]
MTPRKLLSSPQPGILPFERRREWRESRRVAIEVSGFDLHHRFFTERTSTLDVSPSGCCFLLQTEVAPASGISVRVVGRRNGLIVDDPPVLLRVAWVKQSHPGWPKWTVAAMSIQPLHMQGAGFPAEPDDVRGITLGWPDDEPPAA